MLGRRIESKRRNSKEGFPLPWLSGVGGLILGVVVGLVYAWLLQPLTNVDPNGLKPGGQAVWLQMAADSYALTNDLGQAQRRLQPFFGPAELDTLFAGQLAAAEGDLARTQRLRELQEALAQSPALETVPPANSNALSTVMMVCGIVVLLGVLVTGAVLATRMQQGQRAARPRATASSRNRATVGTPPAPAPRKATPDRPDLVIPDRPNRLDMDEDDEADEALSRLFDDTAEEIDEATQEPVREIEFAEPQVAPVRYSPALDEFVTRYSYGDDGFDMSFSIETPQVEFLGECGVGISDTLNDSNPQQVTAFEVWLFDKDDIRTVTKVLLSDHAWANEELRSRLAPKGELIHAKAGETVDLETKSLRVRARIREVEYAEGSANAHAFFDHLVVELTPQQKQ